MQGMKIEVLKKGAKPGMDDDALIEDAIREVAKRIDGFDTDSIMSTHRATMQPSDKTGEGAAVTDGPPQMSAEECEDCARGECANPEHMDEDTLRQMLASMGDKGEG
jgi:hypothetical protein